MDSLPAGYGKTARQGRATATVVKTEPGAYRFTATCDSMEQQLKQKQSRTWLYMLLAFAAGLAGGFATADIIRLLLRRD